jgi:hypothetical protein
MVAPFQRRCQLQRVRCPQPVRRTSSSLPGDDLDLSWARVAEQPLALSPQESLRFAHLARAAFEWRIMALRSSTIGSSLRICTPLGYPCIAPCGAAGLRRYQCGVRDSPGAGVLIYYRPSFAHLARTALRAISARYFGLTLSV